MKISCDRKFANAKDGLVKFVEMCKKSNVKRILDIGAGKEEFHANDLRREGFLVDTNDFFENNTFVGNFMEIEFNEMYDAIWCAHTLEHQLNTNHFLLKVSSLLKNDGILCITVPPLKDNIVGGHVSLWNAGLLLYHLILAGMNCSNAKIKTYGYNISVCLKKKTVFLPFLIDMKFDSGDIKVLSKYFPFKVHEGFNGVIQEFNWSGEDEILNI